MSSGLFGIEHSNRTTEEHWTKNCFNSSFPSSLACYMMANDIPAIYVHLDFINEKPCVVTDTIPVSRIFNCDGLAPSDLYFSFESKFKPYEQYSIDGIDGIDLVVKDVAGKYLAPVEIKLTVLPDNTTCDREDENEWGCELVIRSATTSYCALGMYDSVANQGSRIRDIFEDSCSSIESWTNNFEMLHKTASLCKSIDDFEREFYAYQKPLLMETIWKTQGKSPLLADNAFDIVVFSDFAFSRFFVDSVYDDKHLKKAFKAEEMSRQMRASAKLARCLWELSKSGKIHVNDIYRQMAFNNQTDKEFSVPGNSWKRYVRSPRIAKPALSKDIVNEIIVDKNCMQLLSPERRFDQTLYFTVLNK